MTLKEFIKQVLLENNMTSDIDTIASQITDIARNKSVDGCASISDEEVREMVINNADLANRIAQKKKEEDALREAELKEAKLQKKLEKERKIADGEQLTLL